MRLSIKFALAVGLLLLLTLGVTAWVIIREQNKDLYNASSLRAKTVVSFGEACREYARNTLSPAVEAQTKTMIFEANSATFVARGTFEALGKRMPEYSFREAALNPLNLANKADAEE